MRKVSKKMAKTNRTYTKLRKDFLLEHPMCQVKVGDCGLQATDIHHKKGRGKYHLDVTTWVSACRQCHSVIHDHIQEAKKYDFGYTGKGEENECCEEEDLS